MFFRKRKKPEMTEIFFDFSALSGGLLI